MNAFLKTAVGTAAAALLGATGLAHAAEYANVVSATPVTGAVPAPRQECIDEQRYVPPQPSGGGALIGALIGGVVGNQFGHGVGRAAATGLGVVAGSAIGNQAELSNNPGQTVPMRSCRTVNGYENRVVGYDVVYEYHGQRYTTRMASDPGPRIAIDVRPSAQAPLDRVGPPARYGSPVPAYGQGYAQPSYEEPNYERPNYERPTYVEPAYMESSPYYVPAPAYYAPAPVVVAPRPYYVGPPVIGIGFYGGYGGWRHGGHRWH